MALANMVGSVSGVRSSLVWTCARDMRCLECGAKMRLIPMEPDDSMRGTGYERYAFECPQCHKGAFSPPGSKMRSPPHMLHEGSFLTSTPSWLLGLPFGTAVGMLYSATTISDIGMHEETPQRPGPVWPAPSVASSRRASRPPGRRRVPASILGVTLPALPFARDFHIAASDAA